MHGAESMNELTDLRNKLLDGRQTIQSSNGFIQAPETMCAQDGLKKLFRQSKHQPSHSSAARQKRHPANGCWRSCFAHWLLNCRCCKCWARRLEAALDDLEHIFGLLCASAALGYPWAPFGATRWSLRTANSSTRRRYAMGITSNPVTFKIIINRHE